MEKIISLAQAYNNSPTQFDQFLWWLSTAEKELIQDAIVDRNRYKIIGMSVLATWVFASFAWTYFFFTATESYWLAFTLGFFMGFIILTIDRALIKGINKQNKNRFWPLLFRALLAISIGAFMAQPALLFLFKKEISLQVNADNGNKLITNRLLIDSIYKVQKTSIQQQQQELNNQLQKKYNEVASARINFLAETDGSGGTGKVGIKDIALVKRNEYLKLDEEFQQQKKIIQPKIIASEMELKMIENKMELASKSYEALFNDGFLTQIEALNNLIKQNSALQTRYYLLMAILLLIELMPVIAKTLLPSGTYDEKLRLRELLEMELARNNFEREKDLKETYNANVLQFDKDQIDAFFYLTKADREEKIKSLSKNWKQDQQQTFAGLWEKIKKELLTKLEN